MAFLVSSLPDCIEVCRKEEAMGSLEKIKKEIEKLREEIRYHDWRYYVLADPEVSDKAYDDLVRRLKELEEKYPQFITPDSPTQRVSGAVLEGFPTVKHRVKMLSLDNTYSIEELKEWEEKIERILKRKVKLDYTVELKIDGVSCALVYKDGNLTLAATRGDGEVGEDITPNVRTIKSVPLRLIGKDFPKVIEVRGEIYMNKVDFKKINEERLKRGEPPFANPRNATSGSLKLLDPKEVGKRNLKCFIHSFGWSQNYAFNSQYEFLEKVKEWGLRTNPYNKYCRNLDEVIAYCNQWQEKRDSLDYEVDGVVVKVNSFSLQRGLGQTLKSPRWAVAYKFPAHQATTTVKDIIFSVGRTGIITPVAILNPVECGGVTISRSTLHNFDEIKRLDVRVKDTVLVERAGEVIPKIVKVITSKRKGKERKVKVPQRCPVCGGVISKEKEEEVYLYCINPDCPAKLKQSLLHFASRGAMDIEGMGDSVVEELVERGMVKSLVDIYKLKKEDFLELPLFAEKKAFNLYQAIQRSKNHPLARFLYGLGIRHVGEKAAMVLAQKFREIDKFFTLGKADLESIPEVGPVMAESVIKFFSQSKVKKMIKEFKELGLNLKEEAKVKKDILKGKTIVFTGELKSFTRTEAQRLVEELGGKWSSSVSRNTDYLVVGENPGSKYEKGKKLGIRMINEEEFKRLIKEK